VSSARPTNGHKGPETNATCATPRALESCRLRRLIMNIENEDRESAERHGDAPILTQTEARGGVSTHITRYVLVYGLALVIVAFAIIFLLHHLAHR
jgi:hypothetical protein